MYDVIKNNLWCIGAHLLWSHDTITIQCHGIQCFSADDFLSQYKTYNINTEHSKCMLFVQSAL